MCVCVHRFIHVPTFVGASLKMDGTNSQLFAYVKAHFSLKYLFTDLIFPQIRLSSQLIFIIGPLISSHFIFYPGFYL